jgi:hypothetical protein
LGNTKFTSFFLLFAFPSCPNQKKVEWEQKKQQSDL